MSIRSKWSNVSFKACVSLLISFLDDLSIGVSGILKSNTTNVLLSIFPLIFIKLNYQGFPDSSVGKESAWNAGDSGSIPGLGRSAEEGIGYPLQYSWASLVAQLEKNLPAVQTWVQSLSWENPLEKGKATHASILAWRIPWTAQSMGSQRVGHDWATFTSLQEASHM